MNQDKVVQVGDPLKTFQAAYKRLVAAKAELEQAEQETELAWKAYLKAQRALITEAKP